MIGVCLGRLTLDERVAICSSVGEEVLQQSELRNLLDKKKAGITAYDGFEPSGRMHIAQVSQPPFEFIIYPKNWP